MLLKGEVGGCALNIHGNYIVDHGKSWKNHGIVFLNFCGNPVKPCIPQPVTGTNFCPPPFRRKAEGHSFRHSVLPSFRPSVLPSP